MNELNYASLEASKKLVDNGIILETDVAWAWIDQNPKGTVAEEYLRPTLYLKHFLPDTWFTCIVPAPCFTEVWRELPEQNDNEYLRVFKDEGKTFCGYGEYADRWCHVNPTDALIDLLVWLKGKGK